MKFDERYKDVPVMEFGDDTYLRCPEAHPCCVCGELTHFCEINYEGYFCSEECEASFAADLMETRNKVAGHRMKMFEGGASS